MNFKYPQSWQLVSEVFHELIDLPDEQRQKRLADLKHEDLSLYSAVSKLLEEEAALHPALKTGPTITWDTSEDELLIGTEIGPYRLTRLLGSGGMGAVFLAERIHGDFEQEVALKLIRPGDFSPSTIERFRQERQILASLAHPHIARLYDGGQTQAGRLFFTMEQVTGQDIVSHLNQTKADLPTRIKLFLQVCQAIAHAHTRLVLHLDLKPNNVWVNEQATVKVLDFGVAEQFEVSKANPAEQPGIHRRYTLAYGAPEQLLGEPVSTRTDLYSLGVLLYEILTGTLPIAAEAKSLNQGHEKLFQQPITLPSEKGHVEGLIAPRQLKGDLDRIVMACLAKDPNDRYASVDQLIVDLQAWQQGRPISLRREDRPYVWKKFVRRNRRWLTGIAVAIVALLILGIYYTLRLREQRNYAQSEVRKNEQLLRFVTDIFQKADPFISQGDTLTVYDLLDQAQSRIEQNLVDQPDLYVAMVTTLGNIYQGLNEYERADSLLRQADTLFQRHLALRNTPTHSNWLFLKSDVLYGLGQYAEAEKIARMGLSMALELGERGDPIRFYQLLGSLAVEQFQLERSDSLYQKAYAAYFAQFDTISPALAGLLQRRGDLKRKLRQYDSAEIYYRRALRINQHYYQPPNTELAYVLNHLASLYFEQRELDTALYYAESSLSQRRAVLGDVHVETTASLGNLGRILDEMGRYEESIPVKQKMIQATTSIFSGPHPYQIGAYTQLGRALLILGRYEEASENYTEAVDIFQQLVTHTPEAQYAYPGVIAYEGMAGVLFQQGQYEGALAHIKKAIQLLDLMGDPGHPLGAKMLITQGRIYLRMGETEVGRSHLEEARSRVTQLDSPNQAWLDLIQAELDE